MRNTKELLEKKQAMLEAKIDAEAQSAKRLAPLAKKNATKKREALMHLKRKKMYEGQFEQLSGQIFNLEQTIFAMDKAITNKTLIEAQKNANAQLKAQLATTGEADDISSTLAQDVTIGSQDFDEDDLMAELDDLD